MPEKLECPTHIPSPTFLPPKCQFSNFHAVFGHFTQIVPHKLTPIGKPCHVCMCKEGWFIRLGQEGVAFEIVEETV